MALVPRIQKNQQYAIPDSLTHSSGTITAAFNGVNYSVVLSGLSANSLYYLYLRINGGSLALFFSASAPSVYRASFPEAILVGAFYSNHLSAFGGFTSIEGAPRSQTISNGASVITATTTSPTKGTVTIDSTEWYRDGEFMVFRMEFEQTTAGTNGSGSYLFALPTNLVAIPYATTNNLTTGYGSFTGRFGGGIDQYAGHVCLFSTTQMFVYFQWQRESGAAQSASILNSSVGALGAGAMQYGMNNVRIPIVGWSNTPLKDL